ncbi:hypothetical protein [Stenotrophomonas sp.]|nr:hypothetical protein [Stenotrophomonas sp.]
MEKATRNVTSLSTAFAATNSRADSGATSAHTSASGSQLTVCAPVAGDCP